MFSVISRKAIVILALFLAAVILLGSCNLGAKVSKGSAPQSTELRELALLPLKTEGQFDERTINYLQTALQRELGNSGYLVLTSKEIDASCTISGGCRDPELPGRLGLDGFVQLDLTGVRRTNFLLGIYSSISGKLNLSDAKGQLIASVENSQRYRGGLVFYPGQIVEGIQTTFEERSEQMTTLADTFIRSLVLKLPQPKSGANAAIAPGISNVTFKHRGGDDYLACLDGSPGNEAALLVGGEPAGLREVRPGHYCAILPLPRVVRPDTPVEAQLKSAYGVVARKPVVADMLVGCSLEDVLHIEKVRGGFTLVAGCDALADAGAAAKCRRELEICKSSTVTLYKSSQAAGPFLKAGNLSRSFWRTGRAGPYPAAVYSAIAVSPNGKRSTPVTIPVKE